MLIHLKANNKYIKDYDKNKEASYLKYWDLNILHGWAMSQNPLSGFKWLKNHFNLIKISEKDITKKRYRILFGT